MGNATAAQLIRIARLRRFVGVFARGGDREATSEALAALSRASRQGGLTGDALRSARQAAELLADENSEAGVRSLLQLGAACLDAGDATSAASAAELAHGKAGALAEPLRTPLIGCAALLAGIAHSLTGADDSARVALDEAREQFAAADQPEGAALALTQLALLDVAAGRTTGAEVCFRFARDFYRASLQVEAAAETSALAARALAEAGAASADHWFRDAIGDAELAEAALLATELVVERAAELERAGAVDDAIATAADGAQRCAALREPRARELALRARQQLARLTGDAPEALRHIEAAFELALDLRDAEALAAAMELVVTGLVEGRFSDTGWRLVDRFRDRLIRGGYAALAETAGAALADLRA
jgi:hypothetical protein